MNWALQQRTGSASSKAVLLILANRADHRGICWPGIDGIALQAELNRSTVIRHLERMESDGMLCRRQRPGDGGGRKSNVYYLHISETCGNCEGQSRTEQRCISQRCNDEGQSRIGEGQSRTVHGQSRTVPPEPSDNPQIEPPERTPTARTRAKPDFDEQRFAEFRAIYPKRGGGHRWADAKKHIRARLREGHTWDDIIDGARRYAVYIRAIGKERTEFVLQGATFVGTNLGFLDPHDPPATKADARLAANLSAVDEARQQLFGDGQ